MKQCQPSLKNPVVVAGGGKMGRALCLALLAGAVLMGNAVAQSILDDGWDDAADIYPSRPPSGNLPAFPSDTSPFQSESGSRSVLPPVANQAEARNFFQYGPIIAHPKLGYRYMYATDVLKEDTVVQQVTPGVGISLGEHWQLNYNAAFRFYSKEGLKDTLDHGVSLAGHILLENWKLGLAQQVGLSFDPSSETGGQTERITYGTSLAASRGLGQKTSLSLGLKQRIQTVDGFSSSREWSSMNWLNYLVSDHLSAGVGGGGGYADVQRGSDMVYQQFSGRMSWFPGNGRFSASVSLGGEVREFLATSVVTRFEPTFSVSLNYALLESTFLSLSASQANRTALIGNVVAHTTSVNFGLRQRFFGKVHLDVTPGYSITEYRATDTVYVVGPGTIDVKPLETLREDKGFSLSTRLSTKFLKGGRISLFYRLHENVVTRSGILGDIPFTSPGSDFQSTQVGFDILYRF